MAHLGTPVYTAKRLRAPYADGGPVAKRHSMLRSTTSSSSPAEQGMTTENRRQPVTVMSQKSHPMTFTSTQSTWLSDDGSTFRMNLEKMHHVPTNAMDVYAEVTQVVVPYLWKNYDNDDQAETIDLVIEDEVKFEVGAIDTPPALTAADVTIPSTVNSVIVFGGNDAASIYGINTTGTDMSEKDTNFGRAIAGDSGLVFAMNFDEDNNSGYSYVRTLVWEDTSQDICPTGDDILFRSNMFDLHIGYSTENGELALSIVFKTQDTAKWQDLVDSTFVINPMYRKGDDAHVLTVMYDLSAETEALFTIIYNDMEVYNQEPLAHTSYQSNYTGTDYVSHGQGCCWFNTLSDLADNLYEYKSVIVGADILQYGDNMETPFLPGDIADTDTPSYRYMHAIIYNQFTTRLSLTPHIKVRFLGQDASLTLDTLSGDVSIIPILQTDDASLTFATFSSMIEDIRNVLNMSMFDSYGITPFVSTVVREAYTGSNSGADTNCIFAYSVDRTTEMEVKDPTFRVNYDPSQDNGVSKTGFFIKMYRAPYFVYNLDTLTSSDTMITFTDELGSLNYNIADFDVNGYNSGPVGTTYNYITVSRPNLAKFVYVSFYKYCIERGLAPPAAWDDRENQPDTSPLQSFDDGGFASFNGIENDDGDYEDSFDYRFQFKTPTQWLLADNTTFQTTIVTATTSFEIDHTGCIPTNVTGLPLFDDSKINFVNMANVIQSFTLDYDEDTEVFFDTFKYDPGEYVRLSFDVLNNLYTLDTFKDYVNEAINTLFISSTHGPDAVTELYSLRADTVTKNAVQGFYVSASTPAYPAKVQFEFQQDDTVDSEYNENRNIISMMLYGKQITGDVDGTGFVPFVISNGGGSASGAGFYSEVPTDADYPSALVNSTSINDFVFASIFVDYSRVHESFDAAHIITQTDRSSNRFTLYPYRNSTVVGDKNTVDRNITITLPSGSYDMESLSNKMNRLIRDQLPRVPAKVIQFTEDTSTNRILLSGFVSTDQSNSFPHSITISAASNPEKFAALIGWDVDTDGDIVIQALDDREVERSGAYEVFSNDLSNAPAFKTRQIGITSNIANTNLHNGEPRVLLCSFVPTVNPGDTIQYVPQFPVSHATDRLKADNIREAEFELWDLTSVPNEHLKIGTENAWTIKLQLRWKEQIQQSQVARPSNSTFA